MIKENLISNKIFFFRLKTEQTYYWHYIYINGIKEKLIEKINKGDNIDIAEYGKILDSGWGFNPPKEISNKYPDVKI
jgi:hypothetical protein